MANREQLELEIQQLEEESAILRRQNNETGYIMKMSEVNAKRGELDQQQAKEAIISEASNPESSFTLTVDGYTVDFRTEAVSEQAYQALRIVTQLKLQELEQQNQAELRALRASWEVERQQFEMQIDNLEAAKTAIQQSVETLKQTNGQLHDQLAEANLQINDLEGNRSIAASEAESLRSQVEELRNQVSKPSVPTNMDNGALAEAMNKLRESKRAIYNVVKDNADVNYTARFVDTDEEFTDKLVYIGKYRQLDDNEASRFRTELEAQKADIPGDDAEPVQSNLEVEDKPTIEAPFQQFQSDTVQEHAVDGEVATETHDGVVEESFEQEVKRRLSALELEVFHTFDEDEQEAA